MNKKLIIFATHLEAQAFLKKVQAKTFSHYYISDVCDIIISGMGTLHAATALLQLKHAYSLVINVGFSGIINSQLPIGSVFEIGTVNKLTFAPAFLKKEDTHSFALVNECFPPIQLSNTSALSLTTSDIPLRDLSSVSFCLNTDLVDMEAYGIAFSAQKLGIPCRVFKLTTDFPNQEGREFLLKNLEKFSMDLSQFTYNLLENI